MPRSRPSRPRHRALRAAPPTSPAALAVLAAVAVFAALAAASLLALAQPRPGEQPLPVWARPRTPPKDPSAPAPPAQGQPGAPGVIARVGGRDITQAEFDRIASPYFQQLRAQLGTGFNEEIQKIATFNVLDELIRRELLAIEAQRRQVEVTQAEIDALLMQDPLFLTDGRFDRAKLENYKAGPGSNYLQLLPGLREAAAMTKVDAMLRRRFTPTPAQVRAEWARRNDQVRLAVLPLLARDVSLEPEATEEEWAEYYRAHPDQFVRKTRARLRYARLPLPAEGDSARASEEAQALEQARATGDSLRAGTLPDTAERLLDTGLFDVPAAAIPRLGRVAGLTDTLGRLDEDSTIRVVGPYTARDAVIVGVVAERHPRHLPPMREVLGDVKRRADIEKRRETNEAERRAFYQAHRDRWRAPRVTLTRVTLSPATIAVKQPSAEEADRWYARHGRALFGLPDTSRAWLPPITDSLRAEASARIVEERRAPRLAEALDRIASGWRAGRDPRALARASQASVETLAFVKGTAADTLFDASLLDSLFASGAAAAAPGTVQGPRVLAGRWALWRVDAVDTTHVPPYESVRVAADQAFAEARREEEAEEAREFYEQRRSEFRTPVRYALDYASVRIPPPDSVEVPEAEVRRRYDANLKDYRQDEQLRARHILFMTRGAGPESEKAAKARADSLRAAMPNDSLEFVELAKRFSQEPGAPTSGGDLGWFGRGRMVKEFEEAAFAMTPGEISPVVKTTFGYHIIRLEERKPAGARPFDEVRGEIRRQLAQARGDSAARRSASALGRRLALGGDAQALAAPHGGIVSAPPIAPNEPLPVVGIVTGLAQDLPGMSPGAWSRTPYRIANAFLVFRVRERVPPRPAEFDEVKPQAIEDMKKAKRRQALERKVEAIRAGLAAGASLDSLAAPYGGLKDSGLLTAVAGFVPGVGSEPGVVRKAFAMQPGEVSDTLEVGQGVVWIRLEEKQTGDPAGFRAASARLETEIANQRFGEWLEERRKSVRIEILRPDLKGPRPGAPRS